MSELIVRVGTAVIWVLATVAVVCLTYSIVGLTCRLAKGIIAFFERGKGEEETMNIESVLLRENREDFDGRLEAHVGYDHAGDAFPAYSLHIECPDKEMTLDELIQCISEIKTFFMDVCDVYANGETVYLNPMLRTFEDSFRNDGGDGNKEGE